MSSPSSRSVPSAPVPRSAPPAWPGAPAGSGRRTDKMACPPCRPAPRADIRTDSSRHYTNAGPTVVRGRACRDANANAKADDNDSENANPNPDAPPKSMSLNETLRFVPSTRAPRAPLSHLRTLALIPLMALVVAATAAWPAPARAQDFAQPNADKPDEAPPPPPAPKLTKPPAITKSVDPVYPPEALAEKLSADVTMMIDIDVDGHVSGVQVTKPAGHGFDEAAIAAVNEMEFSPAEIDGKPGKIRIEYVMHFVPKVVETPPAAPPPRSGAARAAGRGAARAARAGDRARPPAREGDARSDRRRRRRDHPQPDGRAGRRQRARRGGHQHRRRGALRGARRSRGRTARHRQRHRARALHPGLQADPARRRRRAADELLRQGRAAESSRPTCARSASTRRSRATPCLRTS